MGEANFGILLGRAPRVCRELCHLLLHPSEAEAEVDDKRPLAAGAKAGVAEHGIASGDEGYEVRRDLTPEGKGV